MASYSIKGNLTLGDDYLEIICSPNSKSIKYNYLWLRDHCRCAQCYNIKTHQRTLNLFEVPHNIMPVNCSIKNESLEIEWPDGHKTIFTLKWLSKTNYYSYMAKAKCVPKFLWNKKTILQNFENLQISKERFLSSMQGVRDLLECLKSYGFGFVTNVEPTLEATKTIATRIGPIQETIFGGMWEIQKYYVHEDLAYSSSYLRAHNDNTYFADAAGLQIFHMLKQNGSGGQTLLVDGFQAAKALQNKEPDAFKTLTETCLEAEYVESGVHYTNLAPVITTSALTGEMQQIRFNVNDRSPMVNIPMSDTTTFYKAYCKFGAELMDPNNELWISLKPGMVLLIDNWRVLHGRAAYVGERHLGGCYISRADWLSKANTMGLI